MKREQPSPENGEPRGRERQLRLPFNQRRVLLRLPIAGDTHAKHVLRILEDHAGDGTDCYLKLETIAYEGQFSKKTAQRAIKSLEEDELIIVSPRKGGRRCNTYRLRYAEMRDKANKVMRSDSHPREVRQSPQG